MAELSTKYMGLDLKSPVIVGSCGLTNSLNEIKKFEEANAGAVVIKSIFEEQIKMEAEQFIKTGSESVSEMIDGYLELVEKRKFDYREAMEYLKTYSKEKTLENYLEFLTKVKKEVYIPVIASVNCVLSYDWQFFAKKIEETGVDALELNTYVLPSDIEKTGVENEEVYFSIIDAVTKTVKIPVSVKIGYYFSALANMIKRLSETGINALVLFNRPYNPEIDIEKLDVSEGKITSGPNEFAHTLRWIGLLADELKCDLSAATGIHQAETAVKMLLAGADTVQVVSAIYLKGENVINEINSGISDWMDRHQFRSINEFRGKLALKDQRNNAAYERVQFMKLYSQIK